ncbi:MAG: phosphatase [Flavobacteriales bacterium]|nr:phosphatase [Flavobacteriales bacterium]
MDHLKIFGMLGTRFLRPPDMLARQMHGIRALVFDWDGVFNDGWKDAQGGSPFSEVDSMGVNLLRFALWTANKQIPPTAIISGQHNPLAENFATREHLDQIYMGFNNKPDAFNQFLAAHGLEGKQVAFFFDDVLDLAVARQCGVRIQLRRLAAPMLENYITKKGDADLLTRFSGGEHGLREACEVLISLMGRWNDVVDQRVQFSEGYQKYLAERKAVGSAVIRSEHR